MRRKRKEEKKFIFNIIIFICFSIFFLSIGYSALNQREYIEGKAGILIEQNQHYNFHIECGENNWQQSQENFFQCEPGVLVYEDQDIIYSWQLIFNLPSTTLLTECYGDVTCKIEDGKLYMHSNDSNGYLTNGSRTKIGFLIHSQEHITLEDLKLEGYFYNSQNKNPYEENVYDCINKSLQIQNQGWANLLTLEIENTSNDTIYNWSVEVPYPENAQLVSAWGSDYIIKDGKLIIYGIINQNNGEIKANTKKTFNAYIQNVPDNYNFEILSGEALVINYSDTLACGQNE